MLFFMHLDSPVSSSPYKKYCRSFSLAAAFFFDTAHKVCPLKTVFRKLPHDPLDLSLVDIVCLLGCDEPYVDRVHQKFLYHREIPHELSVYRGFLLTFRMVVPQTLLRFQQVGQGILSSSSLRQRKKQCGGQNVRHVNTALKTILCRFQNYIIFHPSLNLVLPLQGISQTFYTPRLLIFI